VNELVFEETPPLPARDPAGHKGTFGSVLVVGGCAHAPRTMLGGAMLAARAALRAGAGRVIAAVPAPLANDALVILPEATVVALPVDANGVLDASGAAEAIDAALPEARAVVVGPALGRSASAEQIVMRLVALGDRPLVVDADAIRAFAAHQDAARDLRGTVVFTPHPGEAAALADSLAHARVTLVRGGDDQLMSEAQAEEQRSRLARAAPDTHLLTFAGAHRLDRPVLASLLSQLSPS
jgi:NAD(P)H-hydrate epimerase